MANSSDFWSGARYTDIGLMLATAVLAVVSIFQFLTYNRQRRIMERQADISERQGTITEEPALFVKNVAFENVIKSTDMLHPKATFELHSIGRTPAVIRASYRKFVIAEGLPRVPDSNVALDHIYMVLDGTNKHVDGVMADEGWDEATEPTNLVAVEQRHRKLQWFLIAIWVYEDVWEQQHEYAFCFHSGLRGDACMPYGGAAYNYRRLRKPKEHL